MSMRDFKTVADIDIDLVKMYLFKAIEIDEKLATKALKKK